MFPFLMHRVIFMPMNLLHLPVQLARLLDVQAVSQRELARRCEISNGTINKILDGQRCQPETLNLIIAKLTNDESERYGLICAHLRDEVVRCKGDPTHVLIRHVEGADAAALDLTPEMNAFIGTLARESEADKNVASIIESLGDILIQRTALRADAEARVIPFPSVEKKEKQPEQGRPRSTPPIPKPDATG
jgi:hypothetical protein